MLNMHTIIMTVIIEHKETELKTLRPIKWHEWHTEICHFYVYYISACI